MTTANDIINRALRSLSVIGQGESADASQAADCLVALNDMISSWANESMMLFQVVQDSFALTPGKKDYTIGEGAYDINAVRPMDILQAFIRLNGADYPVKVISRERYQNIILKTTQSNIPSWLYYDTGFPASTIRLWAVPSMANTLYVDSQKPLAGFATLADTVTLPPGYERALRLNLAVELMPEYQVANAQVVAMARQSKASIKRTNAKPITSDLGINQKRRYSIYSDSTQ